MNYATCLLEGVEKFNTADINTAYIGLYNLQLIYVKIASVTT